MPGWVRLTTCTHTLDSLQYTQDHERVNSPVYSLIPTPGPGRTFERTDTCSDLGFCCPPSTRQNTHMCTHSDVLRPRPRMDPLICCPPVRHPTTQVPTSAGHCRARTPGGDKLQTTRPTEQRETGNPSPTTSYQAPLRPLQRPTETRHPNKVSQAHSGPHNTRWTHTPHRGIHLP